MKEIYLDNSATTRINPVVVKTMEEVFLKTYGNPSSLHKLGEESLNSINLARKKFAKEIGAKSHEIVFTSCGTESNNLAIQGLARANPTKRKIIISSIEHPSITETCKFMKSQGYKIVEIPVDKGGILDNLLLEKEIDKDVLLVSLIHVNNIFGTIQDLKKIGKICKKKKVFFHTDSVQGFGKINLNVRDMNIDLLSASAHKIGGPKGIGFLYFREGIKVDPLFFGGGQEKNLRSGTENVPGIIGFAKALELEKKLDKKKMKKIRDEFIELLKTLGGKINGPKEKRSFDNIHVSFKKINSEKLIYFLSEKGIYASVGSACETKKEIENKVLKAIGMDKKEINGSIRFTLNDKTNKRDVRKVIREIKNFLKNN